MPQPSLDEAEPHRIVADVLSDMGELLRDCHQRSLALQDAMTSVTGSASGTADALETFQALDHVTQIHDDLARLLPALATSLRRGKATREDLARTLNLQSLRTRLLGVASSVKPPSGDIHMF